MNLYSVRIGLIYLLIGGGILLHVQSGFSPAWYFYLTAAVLIGTHFLFANVWAAFGALRKGQTMEAEVMLNKISRPNWLAKSPRAYFHFTKGMIELQAKQLSEAEPHLLKASELGLRTPNDNALCALNLAHIYFVRKNAAAAKSFLAKAKSFMPNDLMIKQNIKKMETALK